MLAVIKDECKGDTQEYQVVLQGETREEVLGMDAKQLALKTGASSGVSGAGISGSPEVYAIDSNGDRIKSPQQGPGDLPLAGFRAMYRITAGL